MKLFRVINLFFVVIQNLHSIESPNRIRNVSPNFDFISISNLDTENISSSEDQEKIKKLQEVIMRKDEENERERAKNEELQLKLEQERQEKEIERIKREEFELTNIKLEEKILKIEEREKLGVRVLNLKESVDQIKEDENEFYLEGLKKCEDMISSLEKVVKGSFEDWKCWAEKYGGNALMGGAAVGLVLLAGSWFGFSFLVKTVGAISAKISVFNANLAVSKALTGTQFVSSAAAAAIVGAIGYFINRHGTKGKEILFREINKFKNYKEDLNEIHKSYDKQKKYIIYDSNTMITILKQENFDCNVLREACVKVECSLNIINKLKHQIEFKVEEIKALEKSIREKDVK